MEKSQKILESQKQNKQKLYALNKKLREWAKPMVNDMNTDISHDGLTNALLETNKLDEQKRFDCEVIAWFHLVKLITSKESWKKDRAPLSSNYLFEVMRTNLYTSMLEQVPDEYITDEIPTDWMRKTYSEWLDYVERKKGTPPKKGQIDFENHRFENGKRERKI